jgi:hypothetical protein
MTDTTKDRPINDETLADEAATQGTDVATAAQSGSSGGNLAREVGQRDEEKASVERAGEGRDPSVTRVHKSDKPNDGDTPNLPNRDGTSGNSGGLD